MKTSGGHSSEHDQEQSPQSTTDAPENPTRRNMLKKVGIGVAGAALAYYGLSRLGGDGRGRSMRPAPAPGSMTYRTNPKNSDRISLLGHGCMRFPVLPTATSPSSPEIDEAAVAALFDYCSG